MSDTATLARAGRDARDQFRELRDANRLRIEQIRSARLDAVERRAERARQLSESLSVDWVTPYADLFDVFRQTADPALSGPASLWQRKRGQNWPIYQTEAELALLRAPARLLMGTNGYAQGLVEGLTSYVIGSGCTFRVSKKRERDPRVGRDLLDAVQAEVDAILVENQWHGGEQPGIEEELFGRSIEDGEWGLAHYPQADGTCEFRVTEPEQLTQPPGSDPDYSFGVLTARDDTQKHLRYWLQHGDGPGEGEELSPDEFTHFRRNVRRGMKRGVTDFCFDTYDALHLASRLRTNLGDTAAQQASIVAVRQWENASQSDVEAFNDEDADFTRTDPLSGREERTKIRRRGGWEDVPKGFNYTPGPIASSSPIHIQVLDACLRGGGQRWQAPPWLMSGDLNAMNYATSLTAESPFVKTIQRRQRSYTEAFRRPVWYALAHRVRVRGLRVPQADGTLRVYQWDEVKELIELVVTAPNPETRDKDREASRAQTEITLGVQSPQGYMQEQGRDPDQVEADNREWAEKHPPQQPPASGPQQQDADPFGDPSPSSGAGDPFAGLQESDLLECVGEVGGRVVSGKMSVSWGRNLLEDGMTGTVTDSLGRVTRWVNGVRVKAEQTATAVKSGVGEAKRNVAAAKEMFGVVGKAIDSKLSDVKVAGHVYKAVKASLKAAKAVVLGAQLATQAVAFKVAEKRLGQGPKLEVFKKAIKVGDLVGGYIPYGATIAALGPALGLTVGKVTGFLPTASVAYLVFAAVRNPKEVAGASAEVGKEAFKAGFTKAVGMVRKAREIVKRWATNKVESLLESIDPADAPSADREYLDGITHLLGQSNDPEWAEAVLAACLDKHPTDHRAAIGVATEILAEHPDEPHGVDADDGSLVEHLGEWYTAGAIRDLLEARDLSKLHAKYTVDKNGHRRKVWVKAVDLDAKGDLRTGGDDAARQRERATDVAERLLAGRITSAKQAVQLAEALKTMTRKDIERLKERHRLNTGGSYKKEQIAKLVAFAHSRRKVKTGLTLLPPAETPPSSPAPDKPAEVARVVADAPEPNAAAKAMLSKLRDANHLTAEQKQSYAKMVIEATRKMPAKALEHLAEDLKGVVWSKSIDDIPADVATFVAKGDEKKKKELLRKANMAAGVYHPASGTAFLDGDHQLAAGGGAGTYAHELTHAIDRGYRYSKTPEWDAAYQSEIRVKGHPLTAYAATSAIEGFAEFGRAVYYSSDSGLKKLEERFPKCVQFFKERGLWASSATSSPAAKS